jgi:anti-sigma factor RsiW
MANADGSQASTTEAILDEAEALTWALLDDQLSEADAARLSKLLEENQEARTRYIECVQLHVDLQDHFAPGSAPQEKAPGVVVLPNLMPGLPGADARTPISE